MNTNDSIRLVEASAAKGLFKGYGPREIPHNLDKIPQAVVHAVRADPAHKDRFPEVLNSVCSRILLAFAERSASLAVRENSTTVLEDSLIALGLVFTIASRESLLIMPLVWRSSKLVGISRATFLELVSAFLNEKATEAVEGFLSRDEDDQRIESMGYREGSDAGGFRYERTW